MTKKTAKNALILQKPYPNKYFNTFFARPLPHPPKLALKFFLPPYIYISNNFSSIPSLSLFLVTNLSLGVNFPYLININNNVVISTTNPYNSKIITCQFVVCSDLACHNCIDGIYGTAVIQPL